MQIDELYHRGRPVLIGAHSVAASEQLAQHLDTAGLPYHLLNATEHKDEARIVSAAGERGQITIATNMAGRGTDIKLGEGITHVGGLHVIAAERMVSKRVDRQLAGRAGRQGDPGSAQIMVSMEDDLLLHTYASRTLRRRGRGLESGGLISHGVAAYLTSRAQRINENKGRKQREAVMHMDKWLDEALAFSGQEIF